LGMRLELFSGTFRRPITARFERPTPPWINTWSRLSAQTVGPLSEKFV
jgi:hypothetical protein